MGQELDLGLGGAEGGCIKGVAVDDCPDIRPFPVDLSVDDRLEMHPGLVQAVHFIESDLDDILNRHLTARNALALDGHADVVAVANAYVAEREVVAERSHHMRCKNNLFRCFL